MYGLVNKAVEGLVVSKFGDAKWREIKRKAGVDVEDFLSMQPYDDAITYSLVGAAVEVLGMEASDVLRAFGSYWVTDIAAPSYGELMEAAGATLPEFLANLDQLHARVHLTFPKLNPPSFRCIEVGDEELNLHYFSDREGLEPFVVGLIDGLGSYFDVPVRTELQQASTASGEPSVFCVRHGASAG